jgi:YfiH family protein
VAFTERNGGASAPPFDSLNLSAATGDDPKSVLANRVGVCTALGIERFAVARQVHGTHCVRVGPATGGTGFDPRGGLPAPSGDAVVTEVAGVAVAVLVADCLPVALASAREGRVAAVHAGWRGLAAGVLDAAMATFSDPSGVHAVVGPAIGPDHYEVGEEVVRALKATAGEAVRFTRNDGRYLLDLAETAAGQLLALGASGVEKAGVCTACTPDRFYSHRRDGRATGRQALIALLRP